MLKEKKEGFLFRVFPLLFLHTAILRGHDVYTHCNVGVARKFFLKGWFRYEAKVDKMARTSEYVIWNKKKRKIGGNI